MKHPVLHTRSRCSCFAGVRYTHDKIIYTHDEGDVNTIYIISTATAFVESIGHDPPQEYYYFNATTALDCYHRKVNDTESYTIHYNLRYICIHTLKVHLPLLKISILYALYYECNNYTHVIRNELYGFR